MKQEINILLTPNDSENWVVDLRTKREEEKYSDFYKGILLANKAELKFFEEVTSEWKQEHEYIEIGDFLN